MALERYGLGALITADDKPFVAATDRARDSLGRFVSTANGAPSVMSRMSASLSQAAATMKQGAAQISNGVQQLGSGLRSAALGALPLTAAVGAGISQAATFERQMSVVGSITRANEIDMAKLSKEAKRMGIISVFSATQAGQGMEYLARAGADTEQIIVSLQGAMNAAAADSIELGTASDIIAQTIKSMGLQWEDAAHVADVLSLASASANTNITMLGESFTYGASMAKSLGIPLEELTAIFGKLGDAGLQGSLAGTSFTNMMNKLVKPSEKAETTLRKWNVTLTEPSGKLKNVSTIIGQISNNMDKIPSAATRAKLAVELFGLRGAKAYNALRLQGKEALDDLENKLIAASYGVGAATEMADRRLDNFLGRLVLFGASIESLSIGLFAPMLKAFTPVVEQMTDGLNSILFSLDALNDIRTEESKQNAESALLISKVTSERLQAAGATEEYAKSTRSAIQVLSRMEMSEENLSRAQVEARKRGVLAVFEAESRRRAEMIKTSHLAAANVHSEEQLGDSRLKMMNNQVAAMEKARQTEAQKQIDLAFSGAKGSAEAQKWLRRRVLEEALSSNKSLSDVQRETAIQEIDNMIMLESEASKKSDSIRAQIFSIEKLQEIENKYGSSAVQIALGLQDAIDGIIDKWYDLIAVVKQQGRNLESVLGKEGLRTLSKYAMYFVVIAAAIVPVALAATAFSFVLGGLTKAFIGLKTIVTGVFTIIKGVMVAAASSLIPLTIAIGVLAVAFAFYRREGESFGETMIRLWGDIKTVVIKFYNVVHRIVVGFISRWNEVVGGISTRWRELWNSVVTRVEETISKIKNRFNRIFSVWFSGVDGMEIKWENVGAAIVNAIVWVSDAIIIVIDTIIWMATTAADTITNFIQGPLDHLYSFAQAIAWRWEELKNSFINLWNVIKISFGDMYSDLSGLFGELASVFNIFTTSAENDFTSLYSFIGALFTNLVEIIAEVLSIIIPISSAVFGNMLATATTIVYGIKSVFTDAFGGILSILEGNFLEGIKRIGIALFNFLTLPIRTAITALIDLVSRIPGVDEGLFKLGIDLDSLKKWTKEGITYEGGETKKPAISPMMKATEKIGEEKAIKVDVQSSSPDFAEQISEKKGLLESINDLKTQQKRKETETPEVNVDVNLDDKRTLDIKNNMCVDGESLNVASARHKQEIHDRAGYKSTPWQRRVMAEHGAAPVKRGAA